MEIPKEEIERIEKEAKRLYPIRAGSIDIEISIVLEKRACFIDGAESEYLRQQSRIQELEAEITNWQMLHDLVKQTSIEKGMKLFVANERILVLERQVKELEWKVQSAKHPF